MTKRKRTGKAKVVTICDILVRNVSEFKFWEIFTLGFNSKTGITLDLENFKSTLESKIPPDKVFSLKEEVKITKKETKKLLDIDDIESELNHPIQIKSEIFFPILFKMLSEQKDGKEKSDGLNVSKGNIFSCIFENGTIVTFRIAHDGFFDKKWHISVDDQNIISVIPDCDVFYTL